VITPRRTRLVRVPDLHDFRRTIAALVDAAPPSSAPLIVVPTQAAGRQLQRTLGAASAAPLAEPVTRDGLYDALHSRLPDPPRRLTGCEREIIAQASAAGASRSFQQAFQLPFQLRPGLIAEMVLFYDQLRRQGQRTARFEELIEEALAADAPVDDRGVNRLLQQTRFLAAAFRDYERRVAESGAVDEHMLRNRLLSTPGAPPVAHIIVTIADWIGDPQGLFVADFDLLARLPGLGVIDIVCSEAVLASGFHERLNGWMPGIEEQSSPSNAVRVRPVIVAPPDAAPDQPWFTVRDREEELAAVCQRTRVRGDRGSALDRIAVVYKRPLPYLYAAPETFGAAGIPYQTLDAFPLASEPAVAAVDLVLDLVETSFSREAIVALLGSPHFAFASDGGVNRATVAALNRALSERRYLGDLIRLEALTDALAVDPGGPALALALDVCRELAPLLAKQPAPSHIDTLRAFLDRHARPLDDTAAFSDRERRVRQRVGSLLDGLADAQRAYHDPEWTPQWTIDDLAPAVRRLIEQETFPAEPADAAVVLLDDQAARFGEFDEIAVVGLVEGEWPEAPRRNIFYPATLLKALGWPSEKDRSSADRARFLDLLASASKRVSLSTITLDDEALVTRSLQLDDVPQARLSAMPDEHPPATPMFFDDAVAAPGFSPSALPEGPREWAELRSNRPDPALPLYHGSIGAQRQREWSVSSLETYLGCPFRFFAQHVLALDEEPEDEEVMDPRRQGQFVHAVFEAFFNAWQQAGHRAVTPDNLGVAREMFAAVVDQQLAALPAAEAGIERTRLLGSPAAAGLGEAVLRMEAERPVAVVERLLEQRLTGTVVVTTAAGERTLRLRGKADRLDLLADGSFRLIDYKLGWPPQKSRALQLPIYSLTAEQRLKGYRGRDWSLGEAAYLAFKGPRRVVPLFSNANERVRTLADAQQRLVDTIDAIERGEFPPTPDDVYRCETCSFGSVCRKDYVGNV
jgi:RecB family exonuclease